jgi:hypothetical protein
MGAVSLLSPVSLQVGLVPPRRLNLMLCSGELQEFPWSKKEDTGARLDTRVVVRLTEI